MHLEVLLAGKKYAVDAEVKRDHVAINTGGRRLRLEVRRVDPEHLTVLIDRNVRKVELLEETASGLVLMIDGERFTFEWPPALHETDAAPSARPSMEKDLLLSPLPGTVTLVEIRRGQVITQGMPLLVIDAMKMESIIRSDRNGRISEILVEKGEAVRKGQPLVRFSGESR